MFFQDCIFDIIIVFQHIKVSLKGHPAIIDADTPKDVKKEESTWCIFDKKVIVLNIEKVNLNA